MCLADISESGWAIISSIATVFGASFTLAIAIIAWRQLSKTNNIAEADFYHRLKTDFFTDNQRLLIGLINARALKFDEDKKFFVVEMSKLRDLTNDLKIRAKAKKEFSQEEIDDYMLGHFEDLGLFWERKLIDINFISEGFGHYIKTVYEDEQIQKYIHWCHKHHSNGIYSKFKALYEKLKKKK